MHTKELFCLVLLMQACGPLLAQTPKPESDESPGILQRLMEKARETKDKVQGFGGTVMGYFGAYYEDHIQPVTDSYTEWASSVKSSVVDRLQTAIDNYMPLKKN